MQTTIDGRNVTYIDKGEGAVVLLLHGWGTEAATYRLIIDHLSTHFRVVAPDLPGFGGSSEPPVPWGVEEYAAFVKSFLSALSIEPTIVIGHSNGGRILIHMLSKKPCALSAEKAVLLDAAGIRPKHGPLWYLRVYAYKAAKKAVNLKPMKALFPTLEERVKQKFGSSDYKSASEKMRQTLVRLVNVDLTDRLSSVDASTLLIWGECDDATPLSDGKTMERLIPDAGLVVLSGAGHFAFAERWPQCRAVLDAFLL